MPSYAFTNVKSFTPNDSTWTSFGNVITHRQNGNVFEFENASNFVVQLSFLSPTCFRVRFRPVANPEYGPTISPAVIQPDLGAVAPNVQNGGNHLLIDTGAIQVQIDFEPYALSVFRNGQLLCADNPGYNLVYSPATGSVANMKTYPANALYAGLGEQAGANLFKNQTTTTCFNFDNFTYSTGFVSDSTDGTDGADGPLNPEQPLYCSIPFFYEINPNPQGAYAGQPYTYGIFLDNPSQSFFNFGVDSTAGMFGKYYFGALYGDLDYYFFAGNTCSDIVSAYTTLTGRAPMPPKYAFGFHQGGYGYFDRFVLSQVANSYRAARIPIDGLHIDVDFQNNYRTFTHSEIKFPNVTEMMNNLHTIGFKCSTNITPLLTNNPLDETGQPALYEQRANIEAALANALIPEQREGGPVTDQHYTGHVNYGQNLGSNPYTYPPLQPNNRGITPLGADGNYSNYALAAVRTVWGQQYEHLIENVGMDMIWQDMMCPAIDSNTFVQPKTFPLDLLLDDGIGGTIADARMHNIYGMLLLDATWNGIQTLRQRANLNQRNFIIARGGYAGMQRYAALWTGDSPSSWQYLQIYIPQILNIGLSGVPISGSDIGGFANGPVPDGTTSTPYIAFGKVYGGITNYELLTRWMQVGAFLPWFRNHYNGYTKQFQEVYAYEEPVPSNCRMYVEMRYRLMQLFYDAMYRWTQDGTPICRPLFVNDPHDQTAYAAPWVNTEFFVGDDFLVAPILTQDFTAGRTQSVRQVYLPAGSGWYAYKDNRAPLDPQVAGGQTPFDWTASLSQVPLYVRAGAVLPTRELEQYVGQLPTNPLTINIYPGADRPAGKEYVLYQDDGFTFDAQKDQSYRLTSITHQAIPNGRQVNFDRTFDQFTPASPFFFVALLGAAHPKSVTIAGAALTDVGTPDNLQAAAANAYYYNSSLGTTFVKVFDTSANITLVAQL